MATNNDKHGKLKIRPQRVSSEPNNDRVDEKVVANEVVSSDPIEGGAVGAGEYSQQMAGITTVSENDIIGGRGAVPLKNPGNISYRKLVNANKELYAKSKSNNDKLRVSKKIVASIREKNGRFLEEEVGTNPVTYADIGDTRAVAKTSQGLREKRVGNPNRQKKAVEKTRQALREGQSELLKKLAQASDTHNGEQHNEENEEEHAKEDTSEPNDEQSDKEDKKSEEEQHAKDGKSSDDMSISDESSEPAAKKKKGSNSEENTTRREDGEDPIEKCKELMAYIGERAKYDKLEIDIDELFDDLKPVYDDIRELNEQIGELRKKQDKLTEVDKLLRAADKLSHDNGLDYLFDGGFDQKLQDSNDARVKLREEAAGLFGELRGKCVLVDAEQKKIEDELRRRSRTYDRELGLEYRSTPESVLPLKRRIQAKGLSMLDSCSRLV